MVSLVVVISGLASSTASPEPDVLLTELSVGYGHSCVIKFAKAYDGWTSGDSNLGIPRWIDDGKIFNGATGEWEGSAKQHRADPEINYSERPEVFCWGENWYEQAMPPKDIAFKKIAVGSEHTCGIEMSGKVVCWGNLGWGRGDVPSGRRFVSIAAGAYHTCAIDSERHMHCWGQNKNKQCDPPREGSGGMWTSNTHRPAEEESFGPWVAVTAGWAHTCALDTDGEAHCWGSNDKGQSDTFKEIEFASISAGCMHTCAIHTYM